MRRNLKRLEALELAADREIFADGFSIHIAIAYYLGGARHESELTHAYARALGYKDLLALCQAFLDLLQQPPDSVANRRTSERIHRARCELLTKFGYDLRRVRPADLADAYYRIVRTLPEEWLVTIRSAHRESCEAEARANQLHKEIMKLAEACERARPTKRRQRGPRR